MTDHRGPIPVPARITIALDAIGAEGPWVDEALGGAEPMVDQWEAGELVPTRAQIELLAQLTGFAPGFFYEPVQDWETRPMRMFLCRRGRRGENGLTILETRIGWDGVLHVERLTPDRPPYRPAKAAPAAASERPRRPGRHEVDPEPGAPGWCRCGMPQAHRSHRS